MAVITTKKYFHAMSFRILVVSSLLWIISTIFVIYLHTIDRRGRIIYEQLWWMLKYRPDNDSSKFSISHILLSLALSTLATIIMVSVARLTHLTRKFMIPGVLKFIWIILIALLATEFLIKFQLVRSEPIYRLASQWQYWIALFLVNACLISYSKILTNLKDTNPAIIKNILKNLFKSTNPMDVLPTSGIFTVGFFILLCLALLELVFFKSLENLHAWKMIELSALGQLLFNTFVSGLIIVHTVGTIWIASFVWDSIHLLFARDRARFDRNKEFVGKYTTAIGFADTKENLDLLAYGSSIMSIIDQLTPIVQEEFSFSNVTTTLFSIITNKGFGYPVYLICLKEDVDFPTAAQKYHAVFSKDRNKYICTISILVTFLGLLKWLAVFFIPVYYTLQSFQNLDFAWNIFNYTVYTLFTLYGLTVMSGMVTVNTILEHQDFETSLQQVQEELEISDNVDDGIWSSSRSSPELLSCLCNMCKA